MIQKFGPRLAFWLGHRFVICFTDPADAEIVLNHPSSMDKGRVYKYIEEMIGGPGLFSAGGIYPFLVYLY